MKAPVTLVEYGDYQCPYCGAAYVVVKLLQQHYGKDLRFVFRNFPLTQLHPQAAPAAETAEFAGAHGQYWEAHEPDIMCVAKAITGGLGGMGAMIATAPVAKSMEDKGHFYSTYGWHPRSVAVAIAALGYIARNSERLLKDVATTSEYCQKRLMEMHFREPATWRIAGLAIGVDFGDERHAAKIQAKCRREGLLVANEGESVLLLPALNIDQSVAAQGLDILERCV